MILGAASCGMSVDLENECVYDGTGKLCISKNQVIHYYVIFLICLEEITLDGSTGHILDGNVVSTPSGAIDIAF